MALRGLAHPVVARSARDEAAVLAHSGLPSPHSSRRCEAGLHGGHTSTRAGARRHHNIWLGCARGPVRGGVFGGCTSRGAAGGAPVLLSGRSPRQRPFRLDWGQRHGGGVRGGLPPGRARGGSGRVIRVDPGQRNGGGVRGRLPPRRARGGGGRAILP
eukprot:2110377-Prorocentrum_lima.AAC.1